jgi:hypothetical protein
MLEVEEDLEEPLQEQDLRVEVMALAEQPVQQAVQRPIREVAVAAVGLLVEGVVALVVQVLSSSVILEHNVAQVAL